MKILDWLEKLSRIQLFLFIVLPIASVWFLFGILKPNIANLFLAKIIENTIAKDRPEILESNCYKKEFEKEYAIATSSEILDSDIYLRMPWSSPNKKNSNNSDSTYFFPDGQKLIFDRSMPSLIQEFKNGYDPDMKDRVETFFGKDFLNDPFTFYKTIAYAKPDNSFQIGKFDPTYLLYIYKSIVNFEYEFETDTIRGLKKISVSKSPNYQEFLIFDKEYGAPELSLTLIGTTTPDEIGYFLTNIRIEQ
jgi:hypothetical protein